MARDFVHVLLQEHMATPAVMRDRIRMLPVSSDLMALLQQRLLRLEVAPPGDGGSRQAPVRE
jgi:hypothetical protein